MSNLYIVKMMSMNTKEVKSEIIDGKIVMSTELIVASEEQLTKDYIKSQGVDEKSIRISSLDDFNFLMGYADVSYMVGSLVILDDGLYNLRYTPDYDELCENYELNYELVYFMNNEQMKKCNDLKVNRNFRNDNSALFN